VVSKEDADKVLAVTDARRDRHVASVHISTSRDIEVSTTVSD